MSTPREVARMASEARVEAATRAIEAAKAADSFRTLAKAALAAADEAEPTPSQHSTGTIVKFECLGCGHVYERKIKMVGADALNDERARADRAERAARELATLLRDIAIAPNAEGHLRQQIAGVLARHLEFDPSERHRGD
jgi:hypothetical protein